MNRYDYTNQPSLFDQPREQARALTPRQTRLINLLRDGGKYSAIDISIRLRIGDARSEIRNLRKMGIAVCDEWVPGKDGENRYKLYWIERG